MVPQKGFEKYNYKRSQKEIRKRFDLLAPRGAVLSRSNDVAMETSRFEQTWKLAADNDQEQPGSPQTTEGEQDQRCLEAERIAHLGAVGKGKSKGNGENA